MLSRSVLALVLILPAGVGASEGGLPALEGVGLETSDCDPDVTDVFAPGVEVVCARTTERVRDLGEAWKRYLEARGDYFSSAFVKEGAWRVQYYVARFPGLFAYAPDGMVVVATKKRFPECTADDSRGDPGDAPKLLAKSFPDYPEAARREHSSGLVVGVLWVDEAGRVADTCILGVAPSGLGFEESVLRSVPDRRYEPAGQDTLTRTPVSIHVSFDISASRESATYLPDMLRRALRADGRRAKVFR